MVGEVAQIARIETRMREYLTSKWRIRADQSARRAGSIVSGGGSLKSAYAAVDKIMGVWGEDVSARFANDITDIYRRARKAGWKKANGQTSASLQYVVPNFTEQLESGKAKVQKAKKKVSAVNPTFDLYDEQAVMQLHDDQMLWIGLHYDENVRDTVREAVVPSVIEGVGNKEAGKRVAEAVAFKLRNIYAPGGFSGSDAKYFEGLAANTTTNARVRGQVRSFVDIGVTRYELVNPMDRRTTAICQFMNGRTFSVPEGVSQIESVAGATVPDDVRKAHPWLPFKEVQRIEKAGGERALAKAGFSLPPFHFRCRTTVDVAAESMSFSSLKPAEIVDVPDRVEPTRRNTPKNPKATTRPAKTKQSKRPATIPKGR
jgi:hypothetical protein